MSCCGLNDVFTDKVSRREAERYRKHGLPKRARRLLTSIERALPLPDRRTLEIGVGAGAFTVELLRHGAAHAVGVDAVAAQLAAARTLAAESGVADRAEFVLGDFTQIGAQSNADIVVLDRVVCCYPDWQTLLTAAAARADMLIAMTYPRDRWPLHTFAVSANLWLRLTRSDFRFHVHPVAAMHALLRAQGFTPNVTGHFFGWELLIATR